ncbi:MAG: glycosyltransferase family 9 protein [Desulfobacterales bacterium]|nr:glycosyltransferase family 9 protein [Desulfobacterales bacterium]
MKLRLDCKHFVGEKPCRYKLLCEDCDKYAPMGSRILIIKLAAMGDVLRTTPILRGFKRKYPESHITWLTDENVYGLLKENPLIDRLLVFNVETVLRLEVEEFDLLLCLDKEPRATALAIKIKAKEKLGFGMSPEGNVFPLNEESVYLFKLGLSDPLKFVINAKTYPELIYESSRLEYQQDEYILTIPDEDVNYARSFLLKHGISEEALIIGLNTGAGDIFANKAWTIDCFVELIETVSSEMDAKILLLGGPNEIQRNREICSRIKYLVYDVGCHNTLQQFCALINLCDLVVSGDTIAMHIAIALRKLVVAIFGPTCAQEIELYGRGRKIVSELGCGPCYKRECNKEVNCMNTISVDEVYHAVLDLLKDNGKI